MNRNFKFLNVQHLVKCILSVFPCWGGANSTFVGYTTMLLRMQCLIYVVFINLVPAGRDRASRARGTLVPRPMIVVFGLGTRLYVRMRTKSENGVLRNGQQPQCCKCLLLTRVNLKL